MFMKSAKLLLIMAVIHLVVCEQTTITPETYAENLESFKKRNPTHLAFAIAEWCSDCAAAHDIMKSIEDDALKTKWSVLTADVGLHQQWRDPNNYMKKDPLYQAKNIPSVFLVKNGEVVFAIREDEIFDFSILNKLLDIICKGPDFKNTSLKPLSVQ